MDLTVRMTVNYRTHGKSYLREWYQPSIGKIDSPRLSRFLVKPFFLNNKKTLLFSATIFLTGINTRLVWRKMLKERKSICFRGKIYIYSFERSRLGSNCP